MSVTGRGDNLRIRWHNSSNTAFTGTGRKGQRHCVVRVHCSLCVFVKMGVWMCANEKQWGRKECVYKRKSVFPRKIEWARDTCVYMTRKRDRKRFSLCLLTGYDTTTHWKGDRQKKRYIGREERVRDRRGEWGLREGENKILLKQRAVKEILILVFKTKAFLWFSQSTGRLGNRSMSSIKELIKAHATIISLRPAVLIKHSLYRNYFPRKQISCKDYYVYFN